MPSNTPETQALLPVTQADRDAAADMYQAEGIRSEALRTNIRAGHCDELPSVQAFARHRISHSLPGDVGTDAVEAEIKRLMNGLRHEYLVDADAVDGVENMVRLSMRRVAALTPSALSGDAGEGESGGWRPIETCPQEDLFVGAVHVRDNRSGAEWWERHLLALDDETGEIHADYEQGWALSDYSWWLPFSTPPIPPALPSHQGAE